MINNLALKGTFKIKHIEFLACTLSWCDGLAWSWLIFIHLKKRKSKRFLYTCLAMVISLNINDPDLLCGFYRKENIFKFHFLLFVSHGMSHKVHMVLKMMLSWSILFAPCIVNCAIVNTKQKYFSTYFCLNYCRPIFVVKHWGVNLKSKHDM